MTKKYLFYTGTTILTVAILAGAGCSKKPITEVPESEYSGTEQQSDIKDDNAQAQALDGVPPTADIVIPDENVTEITMLAKKWEFTPKTITVKKGEKVRLSISSADVDHSFTLPAFNIDARLTAGESTVVEFTPDTVGTFPFTCAVYCGAGHGDMRGEVVVTE